MAKVNREPSVVERMRDADMLLLDATTANPQLDQRVRQARLQLILALAALHSQASDEGKA